MQQKIKKIITHFSEGSNHFQDNLKKNEQHIKIAACIENNSHGLSVKSSVTQHLKLYHFSTRGRLNLG